jgi:1-aminocyclopropane-1-carboxylate deaminase/D-cysteine desulfhydrase-like pyridoxal-dependent ACC family enzyme
MPLKQDFLRKFCSAHTASSFPLHSRAHPMQEKGWYVKRDDELGFSISGSKLRKYASILPFIKKTGKPIALVGSFSSNHILSFLQLVKQENIPYQLFLEKTHGTKGNAFFLSLLLKENEVIWVDHVPLVLEKSWTGALEQQCAQEFLWIPMGGCMKEALMGALTLALDLLENERELGVFFDHVFVDAGTGMSAIALILGMSYLRRNLSIHVVSIAGNKEEFTRNLLYFHGVLQELLGASFSILNFEVHELFTAKSFGSWNASVRDFIKKTAEKEGIFLDPVYTAKLLMRAKQVVSIENLKGNIVWVHSGGALSLAGFQELFSQYLPEALCPS